MATVETYTGPKGLKFVFTETEPDGGGTLEITATDPEHKEYLCDHHRRDVPKAERWAPMLDPSAFTVVHTARDTRYGREAWYAFPIALDDQWFIPYKKTLERMTGYAADIGDFRIDDPRPLCPTHHRADFRVEDGHVQATVFVTSSDWNGKTAVQYGLEKAENYFIREVSYTPPVREFIQSNNGAYHRNPKYGTGYQHAAQPSTTNTELWGSLFAWWRKTHANPAQTAILNAVESLTNRRNIRRYPWSILWRTGPDAGMHVPDADGTCNYDGKGLMVSYMTWEEFAKLA